MYMPGWPVVLRLTVQAAVDPTFVEAELKFSESDSTVRLSGELFGPSLGILVWRRRQSPAPGGDDGRVQPPLLEALEGVEIPADRPEQFPIVDRFIGGDDDRLAWHEGIEQLHRAGFSAIMLPPIASGSDMLLKAGGRHTAWAVYSPPGYAFDHDPKVTPEAIRQWAQQQAKPYSTRDTRRQDMAALRDVG